MWRCMQPFPLTANDECQGACLQEFCTTVPPGNECMFLDDQANLTYWTTIDLLNFVALIFINWTRICIHLLLNNSMNRSWSSNWCRSAKSYHQEVNTLLEQDHITRISKMISPSCLLFVSFSFSFLGGGGEYLIIQYCVTKKIPWSLILPLCLVQQSQSV